MSAIVGCESGPEIAPVSGRVLLDGEPLPFGFVRFHPVSGQPAQGEIGSDGGFTMSTVSPGDGAPVGRHRVSVLCFEGHDPARRNSSPGAEVSLGRPLLPIAYTRSGMSGLEIEVPPEGLQDHVIELSSSGPGG
ncbi:hypothetical protein [Botrimarina sp.]|uniref:hypothetical protein n=1 Tax=Botrimarina sp. TaxID=2795802 RepID=UPI0032EEA025